MLTQFETWLLNEFINVCDDSWNADPGESVDTMDAIEARKKVLEQVIYAYIRTLGPEDRKRLRRRA